MQIKQICGILFGLLLSTFGYSQVQNQFFSRVDSNAFNSPKKITLFFDNLNFVRNTEYQSKITRGRTLFGYQMETNVRYRISPNAYVQGGLWLKRDFGGDGFHQIQPLFALHIRKQKNELVFGNLLGTTDHQLIDPLLNPEVTINNRLENGLQVIHRGKRFYTDVWLDWQRMIYPGSNFEERFVAGHNTVFKLVNRKKFKWDIYSQAFAFHSGGEIDVTLNSTVSQYNFNHGTRFRLIPDNDKIKSIELRTDFAYYEDQSTLVQDTYIDGLGQLVSLSMDMDPFRIMVSYWDSHQFQSSKGDPIYHSVSRINHLVHTANYRKMLIGRLAYEKQINDELGVLFRGQVLNDLHTNTNDIIMDLYFRWKFNLGLSKK